MPKNRNLTVRAEEDRQGGQSPPGSGALPAAIEVCQCLCGQEKCVVTAESCAHCSHRRQPNPLSYMSSHTSGFLSSRPRSVFFLSFSLLLAQFFILPLCPVCLLFRNTHTHTWTYTHTHTHHSTLAIMQSLWMCVCK